VCCVAVALTAVGCGGSHAGASGGAEGGTSGDADPAHKKPVKDAEAEADKGTDAAEQGHDASMGTKDAGKDAASQDASEAGAVQGNDAGLGPDTWVDAAAPTNDKCTSPTMIPITGNAAHVDIPATTLGATHDVDAPCVSDHGADVFYEFGVSKRVFVYADTFGASWNTVLYLLASDCTAMSTSTTAGDAVCNDDGCGQAGSQIAAVLEPGDYILGLTGRGHEQGTATIHFEFALAGGGAVAPLPQGNTVQPGTTSGESNITDLSSSCIAAGPDSSYWWTGCPSDPGGSLTASTCGGASFETVLELEIPASAPYQCSLDACDLQTTLSATIPAGAGLRVLSVDGEGGSDQGSYTLTADRP
jgi:hypothetical protein